MAIKHTYSMSFKEFLKIQESIPLKSVFYEPGLAIPSSIPKSGLRNSGAKVMKMTAVVNPFSPKNPEPIFRAGRKQGKTRIAK